MNKIVSYIAALFLNILAYTWRININGELIHKKGVIVFLHGKMLPCWFIFKKLNPYGVVSQSKDGEILSTLLSIWNFKLIRGSSSKDSKEVMAQIKQQSKTTFVLMTPDGPRGPAGLIKPGAVVAAARANVSVQYIKVKIQSKWTFAKSWDKFELPKPFAKIELSFSEQLQPANDRDEIDRMIAEIEKGINEK